MPDILLNTMFNNPLLKTEDVTVFRDAFARSDAALAGSTTDVGNLQWQELKLAGADAQAVIRSGRAGVVSGAATTLLAVVNTGTPDGVFKHKFVSATLTNTAIFSVLRAVDVQNYIAITGTSSKWALRKRTSAGGYVSLGVSTVPITANQVITATLAGPSIRIAVDGVITHDVIETDMQTATRFGFGSTAISTPDPGVYWDDFSFVVPGT